MPIDPISSYDSLLPVHVPKKGEQESNTPIQSHASSEWRSPLSLHKKSKKPPIMHHAPAYGSTSLLHARKMDEQRPMITISPHIEEIFQNILTHTHRSMPPPETFTQLHLVKNIFNIANSNKFSRHALKIIKNYIDNNKLHLQSLIDQARDSQKEVILNVENLKIFISKSGKIRAKIKEIGKGEYKTAEKTILIAAPTIKEIANQNKIIRVYGITKSRTTDKALENEMIVNLKLKDFKKAFPDSLSHVLVSKKIIHMNTGQVGIISEFCNGGDLSHLIGSSELSNMPSTKKYALCSQMAKGVRQLHEAGILHRDLHSGNILIIRDTKGGISQIKIADFGLSSMVDPAMRYDPNYFRLALLPLKGSSDDIYLPSFDVYQLGITYYLLFTNVPSTHDKDVMSQNIGKPTSDWKDFSKLPVELQKILTRMTDSDQSKRPTITEVEKAFEELSLI